MADKTSKTDTLSQLREAITNVQIDLGARTPFKFMVGLIAINTMSSLKKMYENKNAPVQSDIAAYALAKRFETEFKGIKETSLKRVLEADENAVTKIEASVEEASSDGVGIDRFTLMAMPDMSLTLQIRKPSERTDMKVFQAELRKAGIDEKIIKRAEKKATSLSAPAKLFDVIQE